MALVGVVKRLDQSKSTICSFHGPYQALRSENSSLSFHHFRHIDSSGHSLRCLHLEISLFSCGWRRWWQNWSLYPLRMYNNVKYLMMLLLTRSLYLQLVCTITFADSGTCVYCTCLTLYVYSKDWHSLKICQTEILRPILRVKVSVKETSFP